MAQDKIIHLIGGPTASGKSALALELGDRASGAAIILNADSMQVYDDLPILTAQPTQDDFARMPHDLYSVCHPNHACSAGNWREMVAPKIEDALAKDITPIVVGGSGLYLKALIEGLSPIPDIPDDIRKAAVAKQAELGNPAFHAALKKRDPVMAEKFHPHHTARLIRAWEVLEATGKSLAKFQNLPLIAPPDDWRFHVHLVLPERKILYKRCNDRFDWMLESGAVEEAEKFIARLEGGEVREGVPLTKALGFKHLRCWLAGEISKDDAREKSCAQTRQYAKRQMTWFRHQIDSTQKNIDSLRIIT